MNLYGPSFLPSTNVKFYNVRKPNKSADELRFEPAVRLRPLLACEFEDLQDDFGDRSTRSFASKRSRPPAAGEVGSRRCVLVYRETVKTTNSSQLRVAFLHVRNWHSLYSSQCICERCWPETAPRDP